MSVRDQGYANFTLSIFDNTTGEFIESRPILTRADTISEAEKIAKEYALDNTYLKDGKYKVSWHIDKMW